MFQRIFPLAIPTYFRARAWRNGSTIGVACLALMCAVLLVPLASAHAQTVVNEDFEDGQYSSGGRTSMEVPPKILEQGGNKFLRITGSAGDDDTLSTTARDPWNADHMNRSTIWFTSKYSSMPRLSDANERQTYSADIRINDNNRQGSYVSIFEFFQAGNHEGYGAGDGQGPAARFIRKNGHVYFESRYNNETKIDTIDLGAISAGTWHNYALKAVWSHNPSEGRLDVYVDGKLKKTISGRDVNLGPGSYGLPAVKFGLYGIAAVGTLDVDNIHINPTGGGPAPVPSPVPSEEMMAVNAGGSQYTAADGTVYEADAGFSGGSTYTTTAAIAGTTDDRLYQSERYGNFSYKIPVANGDYLVTLKFAEIYWSQVGQRVFNVTMEGKVVLSKLDLVAKVGPKAAYDVTLPITVTDGNLNIGFQSVVNNAKVSAIEFMPKSVSVSAATNVRVVSGQ